MSRAPCPFCSTGLLVPIVWGLPEPADMEAADRGEIHIGGSLMPEQPAHARCGDCGAEVVDGELRVLELVPVPSPAARTLEILRFALTYDGYGRHGGVQEVREYALPVLSDLEAGRRPDAELDRLRAALFFLQRQTHHWGELPIEQERWMRALVIAIGQLAPSVPKDEPTT